MEDRLKELQAHGKDNPFLGEDEDLDEHGFLDEFFRKGEAIRTGVEDMRTKVNELREIYDDSLGNVSSKNKKKTRQRNRRPHGHYKRHCWAPS